MNDTPENDCRCDKRINQLEAALRSIVNGDILTSRERAKMALEGTFPPVDEKPEAQSHGNLFAVHDASGKTVGHFEVDEKANKELVGATAERPWTVKEAYDFAMGEIERLRTEYFEMLDSAWGLIANAGGGNWDLQTEEWRQAAICFRNWYLSTPASKEKNKGVK